MWTLRLERPFEELRTAVDGRGSEADDEEAQLARAQAAEQAVAGQIVDQCIKLLEDDKEWTSVLKTWKETSKMGLAWKRYDRLEWVYGVQEQKMFGSMAMQQSHDLELRPKEHYPTCTFGEKGKHHDEPAPIEGFLVRLDVSERDSPENGQDIFQATILFHPQSVYGLQSSWKSHTHPTRLTLQLSAAANVPTAHDIVEKTPMTFDVEPFQLKDNAVSWLDSSNQQAITHHDREALEEATRNLLNLEASDGYINLCHIVKVRKMQWGEAPADDQMDSGSDDAVDFHRPVANTTRDDGVTGSLDDSRTFELVLKNDLIVRLQAYDETTCKEWIHRLKHLAEVLEAPYGRRHGLAQGSSSC